MAKKEERGFRYQKRDKETLKERANMKGGNYDTFIKPKYKQWKPKEGKNLIRILPPTWDDARHYGYDIFINFNIGADNQSYLSLSKHDKGDDPLVEARREAQAEGDKALAKALNPSRRILYWIIDRNDEEEGPLLWAAPFTFDKSLANLCIDEDTKDVIFIDGTADGHDVRFYREGTGLNTTYDPSKMKVLKPSNIHEDEGVEQDWLDFIYDNPIPETLNFYEYDHIKATFDGQAGRQDEDADEKPTQRKRAVKDEEVSPRRHTRTEPEVEEDPEDPPQRQRGPRRDPDDDQLEESPKSRSRTRARSDDDEPETTSRSNGRSRTRAEPEDDEDPPSTRRTRGSDADEEEGGGSLRDRIARRRSRSTD